jgi:uncharacterized membrane protein
MRSWLLIILCLLIVAGLLLIIIVVGNMSRANAKVANSAGVSEA